MRYIILLPLLFVQPVFSQTFKECELKTSINEITIYLQGGLVSRRGESEISVGKSLLKVKALSPYIDEKSVQVKATGEFTILSVNHKLNYLDQLKKDAKIDELSNQIKRLEFEISTHQSRLEILAEKQSLLDQNKHLGGEAMGVSLTQIKQAIEFYDKELTAIKADEVNILRNIKALQEKQTRIEQEIADVRSKDDLPTGEIDIRIEAKQKTKGTFTITYLVANAGWYPKYDVRVASVEKPLELTYKADVYQNTGIDWENVKLKLSNGDPNQSGVAPELQAWYLNYARNTVINRSAYEQVSHNVRNVSGKILGEEGEPLPGASVIVKGTTVGTATDREGNYSITIPNGATHLVISFIGYVTKELPIASANINARLETDISSLEEVVVTGYSTSSRLLGSIRGVQSYSPPPKAKTLKTTTIENQTTVEFEVSEPYSIKSNGDKLSVDLSSFEVETLYQYYAVPKLDKDAFLIARIVNWDQYNLLEGEANLYFEDTYVGRSILDAKSLKDTLDISLGRDKSIVVGREKIDEYSKRRTIGSNRIDTRGFKIVARNKKSQTIKLTLFDQIPMAAISDIAVSQTKLSNGKLNEKTGEVTWELVLKPQQHVELDMAYEVKYPKYEKVNLE